MSWGLKQIINFNDSILSNTTSQIGIFDCYTDNYILRNILNYNKTYSLLFANLCLYYSFKSIEHYSCKFDEGRKS